MAQTKDLNNSPLPAHSNFKIKTFILSIWEDNYLTEEVIRFLFIGFQA